MPLSERRLDYVVDATAARASTAAQRSKDDTSTTLMRNEVKSAHESKPTSHRKATFPLVDVDVMCHVSWAPIHVCHAKQCMLHVHVMHARARALIRLVPGAGVDFQILG